VLGCLGSKFWFNEKLAFFFQRNSESKKTVGVAAWVYFMFIMVQPSLMVRS
jgi:hypothetical protein